MAQRVKTRPYNSSRRREQAAATRRDILEAAQRLFERQGYAATTMAAISAEAGVALKTVYLAFETKSGVLRALWNLLLRGDEGEAPVAERSWYREVIAEQDPERQLRLNARNSRAVKTRIAGVLKVIRNAAPVDPDIGALWGSDPGRVPCQPARARRRSRHRRPLDPQPPRRVAASGRRAELDARAVRAVVRRCGLLAAAEDGRPRDSRIAPLLRARRRLARRGESAVLDDQRSSRSV